MGFRLRIFVAFLLAVLVPMIALGLFVRKEMTSRLTAQYERRVQALVRVIEDELSHEAEAIASAIDILHGAVVDDNRFRRGVVDRTPEDRRYVLDFAGNAMRLTGLSMLQIQDEAGRIISSGHFRNEFGRVDATLPRLLSAAPRGTALVQARAPDAPFLALARVDSVEMGGQRLTVVAGVKVGQNFLGRLARETALTVSLVTAERVLTSAADTLDAASGTGRAQSGEGHRSREDGGAGTSGEDRGGPTPTIVRTLTVPYVDAQRGELTSAEFRVAHDLGELRALRRSIDRWFVIALFAALGLAVAIASWLASRISQPLVALADKTSQIDLDRLDVNFDSVRHDEIGALSRVLGAMTERLRISTSAVKDAERRASIGELARQVNHDIKNGLTPIRNVFRHLSELSSTDAAALPKVFAERRATLESSISYLENLASNYARLTPRSERRLCDVNDIARRVVADARASTGANLETHFAAGAFVQGEPVSLRRILENLVANAIDSLEGGEGRVTISTAVKNGEDEERPVVCIDVLDTGKGMTRDEMDRVFDDFYTTKKRGTGLGLSIVRRLVMDLDGTVEVDSEKGVGSRFTVRLPAQERYAT